MIEISLAVVGKWVGAVVLSLILFLFTFITVLLFNWEDDRYIPIAVWSGIVVAVITFLIAGGIVVFV